MLLNCGVGKDSWDCREIRLVILKGNLSWIFPGRTDAEDEVPILSYLMRRADWLEKTLMLGKIEGRRRWGWQWVRWLNGITNSMNMNLSKLQSWWRTGRPGMLQSMGSKRVGHDWAAEQQQLHTDGVTPFNSALTCCEASSKLQSFRLWSEEPCSSNFQNII